MSQIKTLIERSELLSEKVNVNSDDEISSLLLKSSALALNGTTSNQGSLLDTYLSGDEHQTSDCKDTALRILEKLKL